MTSNARIVDVPSSSVRTKVSDMCEIMAKLMSG